MGSEGTLGSLSTLAEAIGVNRDVRPAVEEFFLAVRANLALDIRNDDDTRSHACAERFSLPSNVTTSAGTAACQRERFHMDRFAGIRI